MRKRLAALAVTAATAATVMLTGAQAHASAVGIGGGLCTDSDWGGRFFCQPPIESSEAWYTFPNYTYELWVIGTDHHVWTRWADANSNLSAWADMGGWCDGNWGIDVENWTDSRGHNDPYIRCLGSDGNIWERTRYSNGSWSAWERG